MKLVGKRVERLNSFGDSLAIQLRDEGQMRLSPALMSRLKVTADNNKIGIAYPDEGEKDLHIYVAPDGDGVAVNKQGYIKNIPHNRDLRSHMDLSSTGEEDLYICEESIEIPEHPGYTFYKIVLDTYDEWDVDDSTVVEHDIQEEDTVEDHTDDSQEVEETDNEIVTEDKENDEKFEDFDLI
ncbi:MAG: hypothetical protein CMH62_01650 [Nanoarchaeota archaeon]|jgi:hypothetical protein|nr:hypothetical protein [Nanoarchaeota archaeon]|tara:strand:+ start:2684 stop:3229 length:546 start_codon:yes stop_codon:yes gene_type:complete